MDSKKLVFSFLNEVEGSGEILNFCDKVSGDGFLRTATISHLRHLYGLSILDAIDYLDKWIYEEQ